MLVALELIAFLSVPSVLLHRRGRPTAALSWLLALVALPGLGIVLWWAFGRTRIEKRRRKTAAKRQAFADLRGGYRRDRPAPFGPLFPKRAFGDGVFTSDSNDVVLLPDGRVFFDAFEAALREAKHTIHIVVFIFKNDTTGERIWRLLEERAQAGVKVRVLVDGFGTSHHSWFRKRAQKSGILLSVFSPERLRPFYAPRVNFVNHRKIAIIDHELAFTGGMNIGAEYEHEWRDVGIQVRGPAVGALEYVFFEDWYFATDEALDAKDPICPVKKGLPIATIASGPDSEPWIHDAYFMFITRAQKRVWIATPYFIPGTPILEALRTAAGRGVDVRVVVPGRSDVNFVAWASRSYYRPLVDAGVQIYEYQEAMLHAKAALFDDDLLSIGTANIDSRSFRLSFEVSCFLESADIAQALEGWVANLIDHSEVVTAEELKKNVGPSRRIPRPPF
jgi:cardiolipin synthase A/B